MSGEMENTVENPDGTYDLDALLKLEPNSKLDGATFVCITYISEENKAASSDISESITIMRKCLKTKVLHVLQFTFITAHQNRYCDVTNSAMWFAWIYAPFPNRLPCY